MENFKYMENIKSQKQNFKRTMSAYLLNYNMKLT